MVKIHFSLLVLALSGFAMVASAGCSDSGTTMVKPDTSAEDIQAASEKAAAEAENTPPS
ncbi:hypothetical protein [Neorhodopirellula lusitana]|uniref:hypothetical protein n=1 Tax=Neorhodopirellula lusitana TaxID=445327 RepID=UPI00384FD4ED